MITLSGVEKAHGGRILFGDVSLQINRGDRLGLVGPNGAGKTTLFNIILDESPRTRARWICSAIWILVFCRRKVYR